jgi:ssDNA-binding Zn-finger/Zn-ribbon topoisomerase 1
MNKLKITKLKCPRCKYTYYYKDRKIKEKEEFLFHDKLHTINIKDQQEIKNVVIPLWECPKCHKIHINWKYYHKYKEKEKKNV